MKLISLPKRLTACCVLSLAWVAFALPSFAQDEAGQTVQKSTDSLPMSAPKEPLPVTLCLEGWESNALDDNSGNLADNNHSNEPHRDRHCESGTTMNWEFEEKVAHNWQQIQMVVDLPPMESVSAWLLEGSRLVAGTEQTNIRAGRTLITFTPEAPLTPGTRYHVRLEGGLNDSPRDVNGIVYTMTNVYFKTSGEKPAPPTVQKKTKKKKSKR